MPSFSFCNVTLISICMAQFLGILHLLSRPESKLENMKVTKTAQQPDFDMKRSETQFHLNTNNANRGYSIDSTSLLLKENTVSETEELIGVAVTLFLHSPTWFQRRNTIMINNVRDNLPNGWKIQIFWMGYGQSQNAIDINPGLKRLIDSKDIILTRIPDTILAKKKKGIYLMTEVLCRY